MLQQMLEALTDWHTEAILANRNHSDPNWNPSMCLVAVEIADTTGYSEDMSDFIGCFDALCEVVRQQEG